jgi:hypothetical protein
MSEMVTGKAPWRPGLALQRDPWRPFMVSLVRLADCIAFNVPSVAEYLRIRGDVDPFTPAADNGCGCAFCTGRKRWEDNWCSRCALVRLAPPKHWENCDVCDACEAAIKLELEQEAAERGQESGS